MSRSRDNRRRRAKAVRKLAEWHAVRMRLWYLVPMMRRVLAILRKGLSGLYSTGRFELPQGDAGSHEYRIGAAVVRDRYWVEGDLIHVDRTIQVPTPCEYVVLRISCS